MELSRIDAIKVKGREKLAQNPLFRQPGWLAAHTRLLALLPHAQQKLAAPYCMVPDAILEAAKEIGGITGAVILYNPQRGNPEGYGVKSFEEYGNVELFDVVFAKQPPTLGPLWFIPNECFSTRREPYYVRGEQLREFVASCSCNLCHDVLFIWIETARVVVIHHGGGFFHIDFAQILSQQTYQSSNTITMNDHAS